MKLGKRNCIMLICIFLLLVIFFCGCENKQKSTLRICFDLGSSWDLEQGPSRQEQAAKGMLDSLSYAAQAVEGISMEGLEIDVIPSDSSKSTERAAALQRLRTEIMTGKGPDVFLCLTEGNYQNEMDGGRLFPYVEKAMEEDLFLPLDDLLESLKLASREDLIEQTLHGGKNKAGQQVVIPLNFSVPALMYDQAQILPQNFSGKTFDDVLAGENSLLSEQVRWIWPLETFARDALRKDVHPSELPAIYPGFVNYEVDQLRFTEDELSDIIWNTLIPYQQLVKEESPALSWATFPGHALSHSSEVFFNTENTDLTLFPLRNQQGGVTAVVSMYCAISKLTRRPEDSAFIVDYLMSEMGQKNLSDFAAMDYFSSPSMYLNRKVCNYEQTGLSMATLEEWNRVCQQIDTVQYPSPINTLIDKMLREIQQTMLEQYNQNARLDEFIFGFISKEELENIVHDYYSQITRLLDES